MTSIEEMKVMDDRANDYMEAHRLRAQHLKLPDNPLEWLADLEAKLEIHIQNLPVEMQTEFKGLFKEQIRATKRSIAIGDGDLKMWIGLLLDNYRIVWENLHLKVSLSKDKANSGGGKATAEVKQASSAENIAEAVELWHKLAGQGKAERYRAGIIAKRMGFPPDTVRGWIKEAGLREA
jgi:hypothetical protein